MTFRTWAIDETADPPAQVVDRRTGGPPPCCSRYLVAADALVFFGALGTAKLRKVYARFPHLSLIAVQDLYLCDACRGTLRRERILTRAEVPRTRLTRPEVT